MTRRLTVLLALAAATLAPTLAQASGGQPGLEIAVDAPWRLEPIPQGNIVVGGTPKYEYGPIPIMISVHDAIFDVSRDKPQPLPGQGAMPSLQLGQFDRIVVHEMTGSDPRKWPSTVISRDELTEIEAKYGVSKIGKEAKHERCIPAVGMTNCDQRLPIDKGKSKAKRKHASHEWHASFYYTPKKKLSPGDDIMLQVTFYTKGSGKKNHAFMTRVKIHAGDAPLPRFTNRWLYGDLHYHSQSTDNEGESGYAYRNVVRAMGAMGMDFVFATDHASDSTQSMGGGGDTADAVMSFFGYTNDFNEARDLNSTRFAWATKQIYGKGGVNETMLTDSLKGGAKDYYANFKGYGVIPQLFMGEEVDSWPEMSAPEYESGTIAWGDRQQMDWWRTDGCEVGARAMCRGSCSPARIKAMCRGFRSKKKNGRYYATDKQGKGPISENYGSRQHMVYLPYGTKGTDGWVSGRTGEYGGATKTLDQNLSEIERKGRAFLAHPIEGGFVENSAGPNMVPYTKKALHTAWRSRGILGLQLWNEDDRFRTGPTDAFSGLVMSTGNRGTKQYQPSMFRGAGWRWDHATPRTKAKCGHCDVRFRLYHGAYLWDTYLRKGLDPAQTKAISWLKKGEPRKWSMAGGSDAHGDLNFRRYGRPQKCIKNEKVVVVKFSQWCDTPVGDTAIGKPRNLVHVGAPAGPGSGKKRRHGNRQVIDALEAGKFSVTDGPALRLVIDKNRNGKIDAGDYEMGSVVDIFPGEQVPVLVEWFSTPEFGPVQRMDLYFGNKKKTFAAKGHGPDGRFGYKPGSKHDASTMVSLSDPYGGDPSGALATTGLSGNAAMHGLAKVFLDPKQFDVTGSDGTLFYLRAYVQTKNGPKGVAGRMAFTNPIWGRYHTGCTNDAPQSLDKDGNKKPDVCEGKAPKKNGSAKYVSSLGGPLTVNPGTKADPAPGKPKPPTNKPSHNQPGASPTPLTPATPATPTAPTNKLPKGKVNPQPVKKF